MGGTGSTDSRHKRTVSGETTLHRVVYVLFLAVFSCVHAVAEPELKVTPQEGSAHLNRPFRVVLEVTWQGSPSDYAVLPAEVGALDWGSVQLGPMESTTRDGLNLVAQTVEFVPNKTGEFKTPEIKVSYLDPEATPPAEKAAPETAPPDSGASPSLRADPFLILVRPARTWFWISGGLGASLLLVLAGWWSARRWRRPQPAPRMDSTPAVDVTAIREALHRAKQHRLDGNFYGCYREMARAAAGLPREDNGYCLADRISARAQEVGYRNIRPTDDEIDGAFREIERALTRTKEEGQP